MKLIIIVAAAAAVTAAVIGGCTSIEHIPGVAPGDVVKVEMLGYEASLTKVGDDVVATVDPDIPTVIHLELVTLDGEVFIGDLTPGAQVVLPPGALTVTVSNTDNPPTNKLVSTTPAAGGSGGGGGGGTMLEFLASTQGWGSVERPTTAHRVAVFSVDAVRALDDWDVQGVFELMAPNEHSAHQLIQAWAATHGQDYVINSLIDVVYQAYTTQFVYNHGVEFHVTALNDQPAAVSGYFVYQNGTQTPLVWAPMTHQGGPLWSTTSVVAGSLFPVDSDWLLEGFAIRVQAYNRADGLLSSSFGVEHQGVPVP